MTWDKKAALDLLEAIAPTLVRRLRMTDSRDTAWQEYTMPIEIDGKLYDSTIRVELRNSKRDGGGKHNDDALPPRAREKALK